MCLGVGEYGEGECVWMCGCWCDCVWVCGLNCVGEDGCGGWGSLNCRRDCVNACSMYIVFTLNM